MVLSSAWTSQCLDLSSVWIPPLPRSIPRLVPFSVWAPSLPLPLPCLDPTFTWNSSPVWILPLPGPLSYHCFGSSLLGPFPSLDSSSACIPPRGPLPCLDLLMFGPLPCLDVSPACTPAWTSPLRPPPAWIPPLSGPPNPAWTSALSGSLPCLDASTAWITFIWTPSLSLFGPLSLLGPLSRLYLYPSEDSLMGCSCHVVPMTEGVKG